MRSAGQFLAELDTGGASAIRFQNRNQNMADALAAAGVPLNTRCGKRGLCRGCEVELVAGTVLVEGKSLTAPAVIKACRVQAQEGMAVRVPVRSRLEHKPHVGETFEIGVPFAHQPLFPPLPGGRDTGFAVDVGTTTVVALLVDLLTGEVLSRTGGFNAQIRFGDNVVTRIEAAQKLENRFAMQRAIVAETIQPLLLRACERAGRSSDRLAGGVIAGNTTMLHLLAGEDPKSLGVAPFAPRFISGRQIVAGDIGLALNEVSASLPIQLLPGIAAYVGADIAAGIFATGMAFDAEPGLLVDMGTNGEVVLQSGGRLFGCATAAGPAFEGCGLRCGTRARAGAVSTLALQMNPFELRTEVIGGVPLEQADGICGSAYIDFLATAREGGLIGANGRFEAAAWSSLPEQSRGADENARAVQIVSGSGGCRLCISEIDVALLLQAKAAIGAGIEALLDAAGVRAPELGRVYLAGGFGMHLNVSHAIRIGLLPGIRMEQVRVVGNSALAGAVIALLDRTTLDEMENLRSQMEVVELNLTKDFEDRYTEHLILP